MDNLTPERRSWNMSRVHSKNTKPEEAVRKALFAAGFRNRKNDKRLPGKPDIVLPKYKTVIFVNGCFWHNHACRKNIRVPKTNIEFWSNKLEENAKRDQHNYEVLKSLGSNVIVVWECELEKKRFDLTISRIIEELYSKTTI